jgi:hypothetical protein
MDMGGREAIAGLTSYGDTGCAMYAAFTPVHLFLDEIDAFIAQHDPQAASGCGADGVCGYLCPAVDPDCPCAGDGQCTTACATPNDDPDCPESCGDDNRCVRVGCTARDPDCGDQPFGSACTSADQCESGMCTAHDGAQICTEACGAGGVCPMDSLCSGTNLCLPPTDGGCGCVAGGRRGAPLGTLLLALGALFFVRRETGGTSIRTRGLKDRLLKVPR